MDQPKSIREAHTIKKTFFLRYVDANGSLRLTITGAPNMYRKTIPRTT